MMWLIGSRLGRLFGAALAALAALAGVYYLGGRDARQQAAQDALRQQNETIREVRDNEEEIRNLDDAALLDRITRPR